MEKKNQAISNRQQISRQELRLMTAPIRERTKPTGSHQKNNLPLIKSNKVNQNEIHKPHYGRRDEIIKTQQEAEQVMKRPQTSKGSRKISKIESQFYQEQDEEDLMITTCINGDFFKKKDRQPQKDSLNTK